MKLAFAIATATALQRAAVTRADCDFGSNYTRYYNWSGYCSFDVGYGVITNFSESNKTSSGDMNVTTKTERRNIATWKMGDKDSTVQCYSDLTYERVYTTYPNGSTFGVRTGDFEFGMGSNDTVAKGVPLSSPGLYFVKGGSAEFWINNDGNGNITKAEGDITDLCEVLGAATSPTSSGVTISVRNFGQLGAQAVLFSTLVYMMN